MIGLIIRVDMDQSASTQIAKCTEGGLWSVSSFFIVINVKLRNLETFRVDHNEGFFYITLRFTNESNRDSFGHHQC